MTTPDTTTPGPNLKVVPDAPELDPALFTVTTFTADDRGMWTDTVYDQYQIRAGQVVAIELGWTPGPGGSGDGGPTGGARGEIVFVLADGTRLNPIDPGPDVVRSIVLDGAPYAGDPAY